MRTCLPAIQTKNERNSLHARQTAQFLAAILISASVTEVAHGDDFGYRLRTGGVYSDNVGRTSDNEVGAGIGILGLQGWANKPEGRLRYNALSNLSYEEIFNSQFSGYTVGTIGAGADFDIIPKSFEWNAKASFQEIRTDLNRPLAPDNRENVTTLGTGPTLRLQLGASNEASLKGTYERTMFSERDFDSDTIGGELDLMHSISRDNHVGVGVTHDDISYSSHEAAGAIDFTRNEAFVNWKATGKRTRIDAQVGASKIEGSGFDSSGPLARITITRRLTPFVSGSLIFDRSYPASPSAFSPSSFVISNPAAAEFVGVDASIASAAARRQTVEGLEFTMVRPRTTAELSLRHTTEVGIAPGALDDRRYSEAVFSVNHNLTSRISGGVFGSYLHDEASALGVHARDTSYGVTLGTLVTRSFSIEGVVQKTKRTDDTALGSYDEFVAGIFFVLGNGPVTLSGEARIAN